MGKIPLKRKRSKQYSFDIKDMDTVRQTEHAIFKKQELHGKIFLSKGQHIIVETLKTNSRFLSKNITYQRGENCTV